MSAPFMQAHAAPDTQSHPAITPVPQHIEWWPGRHKAKLREVAEKRQAIDLVFLGDSITQCLENPDSASIVAETFPGMTILNLGYSGDKTENVLWRLRNGEIDGLSPKAVVLLIGTNNSGHRQDPHEITAKAIGTILANLRDKLPDAKIVLLSLFPRGATPDETPHEINQKTNTILPSLADGKAIFHFDINRAFLDATGLVPNEIMPDGLHLSDKGNAVWMKALKPCLDPILAPAGTPCLVSQD